VMNIDHPLINNVLAGPYSQVAYPSGSSMAATIRAYIPFRDCHPVSGQGVFQALALRRRAKR
jgi:hypothetical protein